MYNAPQRMYGLVPLCSLIVVSWRWVLRGQGLDTVQFMQGGGKDEKEKARRGWRKGGVIKKTGNRCQCFFMHMYDNKDPTLFCNPCSTLTLRHLSLHTNYTTTHAPLFSSTPSINNKRLVWSSPISTLPCLAAWPCMFWSVCALGEWVASLVNARGVEEGKGWEKRFVFCVLRSVTFAFGKQACNCQQ